MKVICIGIPPHFPPLPKPITKEGETYTVVDSGKCRSNFDHPWYELAEHIGYIYAQHLFIPVSDIDETEYAGRILERIHSPLTV